MSLNCNDRKHFGKGSVLTLMVCILLLGVENAGAQTNRIDWRAYLNDIEKSADNHNYIYLYYTRGGELQKHFYCYTSKQQQVMAINLGDTLVTEVVLMKPDIFSFVEKNRKYLNAISQSEKLDDKRIVEFQKNFKDSSIQFLQLGIRAKGVFYNHFQRATPGFIDGIKKEKLKEGYRVVNRLIDLLEQAAEKALADKK